jgi:serine/threonine protein phosphatase 1
VKKTYTIGDIHGQAGKLQQLVARCLADAQQHSADFVFLGDYVDRGPSSKEVIEYLLDFSSRHSVVCLRGNHEQLLLDATEDPIAEQAWLANGGDTCLRSYQLTWASELPQAHLEFIRRLKFFHDDGRRFYVHAGVNPNVPLDRQCENELVWIREPFLSSDFDFGRLIVHGHTPLRHGVPELRPNRLNIDTGAAYGGPLTAAVFSDAQVNPIDFFQIA